MEEDLKLIPLVSIIVPSYNHEKYIKQCIESIINQTYKNWELIVIDDGSTDNSPQIINDLQKKYGFTYYCKKNQGISATLNLGISSYSKGKYITFCASDDYWASDKLEKQVAFLEINQFYPMCYGKTHYVDGNSNLLNILNQDHDKNLRSGDLFKDIFLFKLHPPVNYMFRYEIFKEIGLYDENLPAEDYDMNLRISQKYKIGFLNEFLGFYRYDNSVFKIKRFDKISNSHLLSIEKFKGHEYYRKANSYVYLKKFDIFSGFVDLKLKAIQNLYKAIPFWYNKRFLISLIKLVFVWRS